MPATQSCQPCCAETQTVNIPGPPCAEPCEDGSPGMNAFSTTTANFVVPAFGANVTVPVDQSLWMVVGQIVVASGPATFRVVSTPSATSAILEYLDYAGDVGEGETIPSGSGISPSGAQPSLNSSAIYAQGTAYALTATPALLDFTGGGSLDPTLTLTSPGKYMIYARVRYDYTGATFAAVRTVTTKIRRTNNTAADLITAGWKTEIITTLTYTAMIIMLPVLEYDAGAGDILEIWGDVSVVPTAGSLDAVEAEIVALRIS